MEAECIVCMKGNDYNNGMCEKCYKEAIDYIMKEPTSQIAKETSKDESLN